MWWLLDTYFCVRKYVCCIEFVSFWDAMIEDLEFWILIPKLAIGVVFSVFELS